jgi:acyl carrier protein
MRQDIRDYLMAHRATQTIDEFGEYDSLLDAGVIDSMTMVDLIVYLEKSYGIRVDEDDMTPENFDSLAAIVAYVTRKQSSTQPSTSNN